MKKYAMIIAALLISTTVWAGDFSTGYRMGQLTKYSVSGLISKSGEGEVNLGRDGTPLWEKDQNGTKNYTNPWQFSTVDLGKYTTDAMNQFAGEYVVVQYRQDHFNSGFAQKTSYNITGIERVNPSANLPVSCVDSSMKSGTKSDGFRVGRIVKASNKGTLSKSYEVMIQQGNSGNQFFNMSIISPAMYDCAVKNLKSAKPMKVYYAKAWLGSFTQDSNYTIWKIEPSGDI